MGLLVVLVVLVVLVLVAVRKEVTLIRSLWWLEALECVESVCGEFVVEEVELGGRGSWCLRVQALGQGVVAWLTCVVVWVFGRVGGGCDG